VPLVFGLGYLFASQIADVKRGLHEAELVAGLVLLGLGLAWSTVRRKRGARLVLIHHPLSRLQVPHCLLADAVAVEPQLRVIPRGAEVTTRITSAMRASSGRSAGSRLGAARSRASSSAWPGWPG